MCNDWCFAECAGPAKLLSSVAPRMAMLRPFCPKAKRELPEFAIAAWQYVDPSGKFKVATWSQVEQHQSMFLRLIQQGHSFPVLQAFTDSNWLVNIKEGYLRCDSQGIYEQDASGRPVSANILRSGALKLTTNNGSLPADSSKLSLYARTNGDNFLTLFIRLE